MSTVENNVQRLAECFLLEAEKAQAEHTRQQVSTTYLASRKEPLVPGRGFTIISSSNQWRRRGSLLACRSQRIGGITVRPDEDHHP